MQRLKVIVKKEYGKIRTYPMCEASKLLVKLSKGRIFTEDDMKILRQLGYEFDIKQEEFKV